MSGMSKAMERILKLADDGSFTEFGSLVTRRSTDFSLSAEPENGDGVITGHATVNGSPVAIYSQDRSVLGGSLGEMHAKKILNLYEFALKTGIPVIGMLDSSGIRLEEATDALESFGEWYRVKADASGVVPEIDLVFGSIGGGLAVAAGLADFVLMEKDAELFLNAPNTLDGNFKEKCDTASAAYQTEKAGNADFTGTEDELIEFTKKLIELLPPNAEEIAIADTAADLNRETPELAGATDVKLFAASLADGKKFTEVKAGFAPSLVTGFIRLDGVTTAVLGNGEERISADGLRKAASFVRFADAFSLPVLTLTNAVGFETSMETEKDAVRAASELIIALSSATVPKVNVVIGNALGSAYPILNSKSLGADIVYALPEARIGVMDGASAAKILGVSAGDFEEKQTAFQSAKRGYVDEIVPAESLRKKVLLAMEILFSKRAYAKKHAGK